MRPVLVGCSHGTRDPDGRAVITTLLDGIAAARPDLDVREAFVDVQQPEVADVVTAAVDDGEPGTPVVVVPLLLSAGFHVHVDIAAAVAAHPTAPVVAAPPLGPDDRLVDLLADRLDEAGATPDDVVVVAAAGSSDPRAAAAVRPVVAALAARRTGPVTVGYGAGCSPRVPCAVTAARIRLSARAGHDGPAPRVVVASYLLAPGYFHDRLAAAGADLVTRPLGPDGRLVAIAVDRAEHALTALAVRS